MTPDTAFETITYSEGHVTVSVFDKRLNTMFDFPVARQLSATFYFNLNPLRVLHTNIWPMRVSIKTQTAHDTKYSA